MNWTLEVVVVPVADLDRAKEFYHHQLGFTVDHDTTIGEDARVVPLTPPGSGCSIVIGTGGATSGLTRLSRAAHAGIDPVFRAVAFTAPLALAATS